MKCMWERWVVKVLVLAVAAGVALLGAVGPAEAIIIQLAPVGIIAGQTVRVAVANFGMTPCEVAVMIKEQGGMSLLEERGIIIIGSLVAVQDVNFDDLVGVAPDPRGRLEVFAQVLLPPGRCSQMLQASLEVFNNATGETSLATHGIVIVGGMPAP